MSLPYRAESVDRIAAIHVLEHFYRWEAEPLLREWHRLLKPGGQLILELPCIDKIFTYITNCMNAKTPFWLAYTIHAFYGDPTSQRVSMAHKWGWTMTALEELLTRLGFEAIAFTTPQYHFPDRDMRITAIKGAS
jgi:predicted SAM-dependent methyltransferase